MFKQYILWCIPTHNVLITMINYTLIILSPYFRDEILTAIFILFSTWLYNYYYTILEDV